MMQTTEQTSTYIRVIESILESLDPESDKYHNLTIELEMAKRDLIKTRKQHG